MSRTILFIAFILASIHGEAQSVGISTNGAAPHASAMLDVDVSALPAAGKKGILIPRMTSVQRLAISTPAVGLWVYDTVLDEYMFWNGSAWVQLRSGHAWLLTGNNNTTGENFLGTTDAVPFEIRVNGQRAGWMSSTLSSTSLGHSALAFSTAGPSNTAVGKGALYFIGSGQGNTAIGYQSLYSLSNNDFNTAIGYRALYANTGANNTAIGYLALTTNTSGSNNTALGYEALEANTTGSNNTAGGYRALTSNTTGASNTAFGHEAMMENTSGSRNTAFGRHALHLNTIGYENTAFGAQALELNTTGYRNVAYGYFALRTNSTANRSTALGHSALRVSNANFNTAIGLDSQDNTTTGGSNTSIGVRSMENNITGTFNTAVGYLSGPTLTNLTNTTAIGYNATPSASDRITVGTVANNGLVGGAGNWQNFSDGRFKRQILEDVPGLPFILGLRPVTYTLNATALDQFLGIHQRMDTLDDAGQRSAYMEALEAVSSVRQTGFVAQEVEVLAKAIGYPFDGVHTPANEHDHYTLGYELFTVPLIAAIKEQQIHIEELEAINARLAEMIEALEQRSVTQVPEER